MGVEEGNEEAADGASQRHISSRECRRSKTAFDGLCPAVASANPPKPWRRLSAILSRPLRTHPHHLAAGADEPRVISTFSISTLSKGYATHLLRPLRSDYTTCFAIRLR